MRRRNRTVARLIAAALLMLFASTPGRASLECDGYFNAGYFDTTYFLDRYWSETFCGGGGGGGSAIIDKPGVSLDGVSIGM